MMQCDWWCDGCDTSGHITYSHSASIPQLVTAAHATAPRNCHESEGLRHVRVGERQATVDHGVTNPTELARYWRRRAELAESALGLAVTNPNAHATLPVEVSGLPTEDIT